MNTVIFWIVWGLISFWTLKTFYYSFSKQKLERLRKTAFGINFSVLILSLLPWINPELGGQSGLSLALEGHIQAIFFISLLSLAAILFLTKDAMFLKIASLITIINTLLLFIIMQGLRQETFVLTPYDIAPIIAVLILLLGDVVVLLLFQQLQLRNKKKSDRKSVYLVLVVGLILLAFLILISQTGGLPLKRTSSQKETVLAHISDQYKYTISIPVDWTSDTTRSQAPADLFFDNEKSVLVAVQMGDDPRLHKDDGFAQIIEDIKKAFTVDSNYKLDEFKTTTFRHIPALYATGTFTDKKDLWHFVEYTLFPGSSTFYVLRGNVKQNAKQQQRLKRDDAIVSFDITPLKLVASLPEVKEFKNAVEKNGRSIFRLNLEEFGPINEEYTVVRVFEIYSDHQTTFNRYRVYPKGMISRYSALTDMWEDIERI